MKLVTGNKSTVASQGVMGSSGFAISNSAHMFRILSDGLYSDKVAAVLREIGANAMDAHIMGGTPDLPFEVKLPSRLDSTFHIKDFGPGLDDQEVRELYTTYGWSSKQNSNDVTGAFGLGSKSPFAYTDSFSIGTAKSGVTRIYTAHKDDDGKPVVSLLSEAPSELSWANGVMVTFPVSPDDVGEFVAKAGRIFRWFKVKPVILGAAVNVEDPKFDTVGNGFALGATGAGDSAPRVVMANVAYPLNATRLENLSGVAQALLDCNVHLFLPTGSVMPTPNREDLQYDKQSKPILAAALHAAAVAVGTEIYGRVKEQKASTWQWHRNIAQYAESLPGPITWAIEKFLNQVTTDKDELAMLKKLFSEHTCTVPLWVGNGRDFPPVTYKRDSAGAVMLDPETSRPMKDTDNYDPRGCRVWYYWLDRKAKGTNPVKRKEVIDGCVRFTNGTKPTALALKYTDDITVVVADAPRADMRMKWLLDSTGKDGSKLIMVQPVRGANLAYAQAYAEKLAGDTEAGMGGMPVMAVSTVVLPQSIINKAKTVKPTLDERREGFLEEQAEYFSLTDPTCPKQTVTVGDINDDTDKFFVLSQTSRRSGTTYFTVDDDSTQYATYGYNSLKKIVHAVALLRTFEGFEGISGFFVLTALQVKTLKLTEAGWKPAFQELFSKTRDPVWQAKLEQHADTSPELILTDEWQAQRAGFPGILARHVKRATPFMQSLKKLMPDHPMVLLAARLAAKSVSKRDLAESQVGYAVSEFNMNVNGQHSIRDDGMTRMSDRDTAELACEVYPALLLLDIGQWSSATEDSPELAASLFWQFVHLKASDLTDGAKEKRLYALAA